MCNCGIPTECTKICSCSCHYKSEDKQIPKVGEIWLVKSNFKVKILDISKDNKFFAVLSVGRNILIDSLFWTDLSYLVKQYKEPKTKTVWVCFTNDNMTYTLDVKPHKVAHHLGWKKIIVVEGEFDTWFIF